MTEIFIGNIKGEKGDVGQGLTILDYFDDVEDYVEEYNLILEQNKIISEKVEKTFKLKGGKFYLISETIYPTPDGCNKKIINYILQYDKEDKIDYVNRIIKELKNDISQLKTEEARYKRLCNNINKKLINTQFKLEELKIEKKLVNK